METNNQALKTDYDKDWPNQDDCDCNDISGDEETEDPEGPPLTVPPYTYCVKNP